MTYRRKSDWEKKMEADRRHAIRVKLLILLLGVGTGLGLMCMFSASSWADDLLDLDHETWVIKELRQGAYGDIIKTEPIRPDTTIVIDPKGGETLIWKMEDTGITLIKQGNKQVTCVELEKIIKCQ